MAKQNFRRLIKFSMYSYCITLPKDFVSNLGWKKGDLLKIRANPTRDKLIVSRETEKKKTVNPKITKKEEVILFDQSKKAKNGQEKTANLRW